MNLQRTGNVIESVEDGQAEKLAVIDINGALRMAKGKGEHREAVEAFLAETGAELDAPEDPAAEPETIEPAEEPAIPSAGGIPPCPPETPEAGDKTPEVVAWWFRFHPEEAAKRYANRRFTPPDLS